jgi:hypothetical protein
VTDPAAAGEPFKVFYSCAHLDEEYRVRLETSLAMLRR